MAEPETTASIAVDAERLRTTEALLDIARAMSSTLELKSVLKILAQRTAQAIGARRCSINLWQDGRVTPVMAQFADGHVDPTLWAKFKAQGPQRVDELPTYAEAIKRKRPVAVDSVSDPRWLAFGIRAVLMVPLVRNDEVIGTLSLDQSEPYAWTQAQVEFAMTIANQAALAADNARLYEQVRAQLHELQETQTQLLQAGKLTAIGQLVAGVAHELNNPLAVVLGQADLLKLQSADPMVLRRTEKILESGRRAARIIRELATFARPQPATIRVGDLPQVVERTLALRRQALHVQGIGLTYHPAPVVPTIRADEVQLQQVLLNLLLNAEYAAAEGDRPPHITVRLSADGDGVRFTISDSGPGIAADVLPRIFEPFFTTKPVGQGTGLGLSICYRIVEAHHGRIWAESPPGEGATFTIVLPACPTPPLAADASAAPARLSGDTFHAHVLVVDDEPDVLETLAALFESLGHRVTTALGGEKGWERLVAPQAAYDLVTLDLKMPDLPGTKIWERLVATNTALARRVTFITGDTVDPVAQDFVATVGRPVLCKPVDLAKITELMRTVR
jgi:signal transduction histidine kinase/CheY-like chemotaxis protein